MRVACKGVDRGPVDDDLATLGLARQAVATEGGFATALALVRNAALIASVPERHTGRLREGLHRCALPVALPEITVSML